MIKTQNCYIVSVNAVLSYQSLLSALCSKFSELNCNNGSISLSEEDDDDDDDDGDEDDDEWD